MVSHLGARFLDTLFLTVTFHGQLAFTAGQQGFGGGPCLGAAIGAGMFDPGIGTFGWRANQGGFAVDLVRQCGAGRRSKVDLDACRLECGLMGNFTFWRCRGVPVQPGDLKARSQ